jgi:hypothetical protein
MNAASRLMFICSSEASSFSSASTQIQIFEDVFVFTQGITAMAMTKTKFGISTKDLIGDFVHPSYHIHVNTNLFLFQ